MPPNDAGALAYVSMGGGVVAKAPVVIFTEGLGSCVAVTLYDEKRRSGGLAHVMLPGSTRVLGPHAPYSCMDTAITGLTEALRSEGSDVKNLVATLTGGARMFDSVDYTGPCVGDENIESARKLLKRLGITLRGTDVGGRHGRSVTFYLDTGRVVVSGTGKEDREI